MGILWNSEYQESHFPRHTPGREGDNFLSRGDWKNINNTAVLFAM